MEQAKNIHEPQDNGDYDNAVQNGFDGTLHGDETVYQPEKNAHHNENFEELNQRHDFPFVLRGLTPPSAGMVARFQMFGELRVESCRPQVRGIHAKSEC